MGILVLFWIFFAVLVGLYVRSRGGTASEIAIGIFFSLLCSPIIGFIIVAFSSPTGIKKCPKCAESIKKEAVKCRFCGHEFPAQQ